MRAWPESILVRVGEEYEIGDRVEIINHNTRWSSFKPTIGTICDIAEHFRDDGSGTIKLYGLEIESTATLPKLYIYCMEGDIRRG